MAVNNIFLKKVLSLMGGTLTAQTFPLLLTPLLTRIYTPEQFGILAVYVAVLSLFSIVVCFRFEIAIPQPTDNTDGFGLVCLSVIISFLFSLIFLIFTIFYNIFDWSFIGVEGSVLYLLPFALFLNGFLQAFRMFMLRDDLYKDLAKLVVMQSGSNSIFQLFFGFILPNTGLIVSNFISQCITVFFAIKIRSKVRRKYPLKLLSFDSIHLVALKYLKVAKYSVVGGLSDAVSGHLPVIMLTKAFGNAVVGQFNLVSRVLTLPVVALSSALSQVTYKTVLELREESPEKIRPFLFKVSSLLGLLAIVFVVFFYNFSVDLFLLLFGDKWGYAGEIAQVFCFAVAARFCVTPLSLLLSFESNIKLATTWQLLRCFTLLIMFLVFINVSFMDFVFYYTVHEIILYALYYLFIIKGASNLSVN